MAKMFNDECSEELSNSGSFAVALVNKKDGTARFVGRLLNNIM